MIRWTDFFHFTVGQSILIFVPGHRRNGRLSLDHRDAFFNRTDDGAEVTADACVLYDFVPVDITVAGARDDRFAAAV